MDGKGYLRHSKNTAVVYRTPKTLYDLLSQFSLNYIFLISLLKSSGRLYSTYYSFFFVHVVIFSLNVAATC